MFQTGLLILTSSPRLLTSNVGAYLKAAKSIVNKTLYIKLEPNRHQLWPIQQPVFTPHELSQLRKLIPDIYFKAAGLCAHLDVRVLQGCFKDAALRETHLKSAFDVVLTDGSHASSDLEQYVGHQFDKTCSNFQHLGGKLNLLPDKGEEAAGFMNGFSHGSNGIATDAASFQIYESVCLGGTFDRLHLGHKVLLSEAVLHASGKLVVGVTDGDMLKGKLLWELIEPLNVRVQALLEFLQEVDPTVHYDVVPIYDPYGPTIVDRKLECLYVSEETMKGGRKVNEERAKQLKVEAELRFQSTMVTMLGKLEEVKRAFCGDDPTTFLNIEDHLRFRLARSSFITTDEHTPDERVPGPKIFFGSEKQIVSGKQSVKLSFSTTLGEALVMCLCVYYIRGLSYPVAYGQTLGLLQCLLIENDEFSIQFKSEKLRKLLMAIQKQQKF